MSGGTISITQETINHPLNGQILLGIPFVLQLPPLLPLTVSKIYLYSKSASITYKTISTSKRTVNVIFYNDAFVSINFNSSELVFSTSITYSPTFDPAQTSNSKTGVFKVSRYCTNLTIADINLNQTIDTNVAWTSSDITIDYTDDTVFLSLYSNGMFNRTFSVTTYNTQFTNSQFAGLPTGNYYFVYTFNPTRNYDFVSGDDIQFNTNTFSFITQYIQYIEAEDVLATSSSGIITANFGNGYIGNTYRLSITGVTSVTIDTTFPCTYYPPSLMNTTLYTATVTACISDPADTNRPSTTFTVYKYITSITIDNKIIQSSLNRITWVGGRINDSFKSNGRVITSNGVGTFGQNSPIDTNIFVPGTEYTIVPFDTNENTNNYGTFYFDSIPPNQIPTVSGPNGPFLSNSTLTWSASYTSSTPAGLRKYPVTIGGYAYTSIYNTLSISNATLNYGVPYTISVVDIILTTNYVFYEKPYQVTIVPGYINYPNTITWTSSTNPNLNVIMGSVTFTDKSPVTKNLTEANANTNSSQIKFWPPNSTSTNAVSCLNYTLSANTFTFWNGGTVPLFQDITFSVQVGNYLYPQDTFSLFLYRNNSIVQEFERNITLTSPFVWKPYNYETTYLANDQLMLKSNRYVNFGLSTFTFQTNATVTLDNTQYSIFSTVTSTLHIGVTPIPSFTVYLYSASMMFSPVLLTTTNQSIYTFKPSTIPFLNSNYLNKNVYLLYTLDNSPTVTIESPPFQLYQNATVTFDQPNYTIISTIISTLNIPPISPQSFTVQLMNGITPYLITTYMNQTTFPFKAYDVANTPYVNTDVYLQFILNGTPSIIINSAMFQISSTYFTLDKPPPPVPEFARATSNVICVTQKKNNVPTTNISIKNNVAILGSLKDLPHFAVPCGIITYLDELNALLKTMTIRAALLFLIQKYSIPIPSAPIVNRKRYIYPTADANVKYPIVQYNTTFRLGEDTVGYPTNTNPALVEKLYDARILSIANDDTKTLSSYYTDMLVNATYWLNTLPPLVKDGSYFYCVARPINGTLKQIITASVTLLDNQLIFTPIILRVALLFYVPYPEGDIAILYSSARITDVISYVQTKYYETFLDDTTAL